MFWLKYFQGLIKSLHGNTSPNELASGFALGAMLGLLPKTCGMSFLFWLIVLLINVNFGMVTAAALLFAMVGALTDPWCERLGYHLLAGIPSLHGFWTTLYNLPGIPFTSFNNSLVLGNFIVGVILFIPVFLLFRVLVIRYRVQVREKISKWRVIQAIQASSWFDLYSRWVNR